MMEDLRVPDEPKKLHTGIVLFENFELLDVFGPAQLFGMLKTRFEVSMIGQTAKPVISAQGPTVLVDREIAEVDDLDILLVPGGAGTRTEIDNEILLSWIREMSSECSFVTSVCTGSALLAKAGLLDGKRATSNKSAFEWVSHQGPDVEWVCKARWVSDGRFWTSSGVSAGMDMSLALIEEIHGADLATLIANATEYERHNDATWDPFSELYEFTKSEG